MCHCCGCREIPLIKEFIAEHERVANAAGDAVRTLERGDTAAARELVDVMSRDLATHWQGEEDGLFPASLTALSGDEWDASMAAWRAAHPQENQG